MGVTTNGRDRDAIRIGQCVDIVQKANQGTGTLTRGKVQEILTNSRMHPHGIKVRLEDGSVGRVVAIIDTGIAHPIRHTTGVSANRNTQRAPQNP
jgi:uncharacterized repeat protein (TIGR03833 family)